MQRNIAMKYTGYVAWILLYKHCEFDEKICYSSRDIEFFLGDYYFSARPVYKFLPSYTAPSWEVVEYWTL